MRKEEVEETGQYGNYHGQEISDWCVGASKTIAALWVLVRRWCWLGIDVLLY